MNFFETLKLALKNIAGSKMRTFLTMLGIIIGVTAVIVIVGMGNGMENYMRSSFAAMGTNSLNVTITGRGTARSVSVEQMYEIVDESPWLDRVSPTVDIGGGIKVGAKSHRRTSVTGVSEEYLAIKSNRISTGRALQYMDVADRKSVCVVGSYVNDTYYAGRAVGDTIRIGGNRLRIVGVLAETSGGMEEGGANDLVLLPYSTAARISRLGSISAFTVTVVDENHASEGKADLENALLDIFGDSNAYFVSSMADLLDMLTGMISTLILVLSVIAAISLVVGGIGIMNIMLVSVTERTREIGIRKALGAKESSILWQFVLEAATTSAIGGGIGILLGYLLSSVATQLIKLFMTDTELVVTPSAGSVAMAFGVSAGIGILFGYLPARKAARLNPIDALRYE